MNPISSCIRSWLLHRHLRFISLPSLFFLTVATANATQPPGSEVEVVIADQRAKLTGNEWISESLGIAVTCDSLHARPGEVLGRIYIWSLHTGRVVKTFELPSVIQAFAVSGGSAIACVVGGTDTNVHEYGGGTTSQPYTWIINLQSGDVVTKLSPWNQLSQTAQWIEDAAFSSDGSYIYLSLNKNRFLRYTLVNSSVPPVEVSQQEWNRSHSSFSVASKPSLPNWFSHSGTSSGRLTLNAIDGHAGLWRNDTWELVKPLGYTPNPLHGWCVSPDGSVVMAIRENEDQILWDLKTLKASHWKEPNLALSRRLTYNFGGLPTLSIFARSGAFTPDGAILRFIRNRAGGGVDFVSRLWRSGREQIDQTLSSSEIMYDKYTKKLSACYSDDGMRLAVRINDKVRVLSWTGPNLSPATKEESFNSDPDSILCGFGVGGQSVILLSNPAANSSNTTFVEYKLNTGYRSEPRELATSGHGKATLFTFSYPELETGLLWYQYSGSDFTNAGLLFRKTPTGPWIEMSGTETVHGAGVSFPTRDSEPVIVAWSSDRVQSFNSSSGSKLDEFALRSPLMDARHSLVAPLAKRVFAPMENGGLQILDIKPDGHFVPVAQLWSPVEGSLLAVLPNGRYSTVADVNSPLFFKRDGSVYPIEEYDAELNQPDAVAAAMGAPSEVVTSLAHKRERRLARLGLSRGTPLARPSFTLSEPPPVLLDAATLTLEGIAKSAGVDLTAIDAFVNDVPIFGRAGQDLQSGSANDQAVKIEIPLVSGSNKIQIAVRDANNVSSIRETFYVFRSAQQTSRRRFVLAIGVADYDDPTIPKLQYAAKDAEDIATHLAGSKEAKTLVLTNQRARHDDILAAKAFLRQSRPDDEVIVYVSGHGTLDREGNYVFCPVDFRMNNASNGVTFADLDGLFDCIPALARLLLVDSCHSGELTDDQVQKLASNNVSYGIAKNVRVRTSKSLPTEQLHGANEIASEEQDTFLDLRRTTGATVLSASAGAEFSFETDTVQNGLFTYALLTALQNPKTDVDNDGRITASELVKAVSETVSSMTDGQQHPNARFTNLALDFPITNLGSTSPPVPPHEIVERLLEWSSGSDAECDPRLKTCFSDSVLYFGKKVDWTAIEAATLAYNARFYEREFKIVHMDPPTLSSSGEATIRYEVTASAWIRDGQPNGGRQNKDSTTTMEAIARPFGKEWKIVSLRSLVRGIDSNSSPLRATIKSPFVNNLGMKFVPVPGTTVLFSIGDTRRKDYAAYAAANRAVNEDWKSPGFEQSDDHPVVNVSWNDAKAFCQWLSKKEARTYRLPTDHEWSLAVGVGDREDPQASPKSKNSRIAGIFPWGTQWPPPKGSGNFADIALRKIIPSHDCEIIEGFDDGFATTSPIITFAPNPLGLYDMAGNVWQWCEDGYDPKQKPRVLRGGSWGDMERLSLLSSFHRNEDPASRRFYIGFRVVLEP